MARAGPHRRALIQEREFARVWINRESADRTGGFALECLNAIYAKEPPAFEVKLYERRIRRLSRQSERNQSDILGHLEVLRLQPEEMDALGRCGIDQGLLCRFDVTGSLWTGGRAMQQHNDKKSNCSSKRSRTLLHVCPHLIPSFLLQLAPVAFCTDGLPRIRRHRCCE